MVLQIQVGGEKKSPERKEKAKDRGTEAVQSISHQSIPLW